jgi:hypothetical protein
MRRKMLSFLRSVNFLIKSFLTESSSKLLIRTEINKFSRINCPKVSNVKKKIEDTIGLLVYL